MEENKDGNTQPPTEVVQEPISEPRAPQEAPKEATPETIETSAVAMGRLTGLAHWPQALAMIEVGKSISDVARYLQVDCKEYTDVRSESLQRYIRKFLKDKKDGDVTERVATTAQLLMESAPENVDPLDALNMLFAVQVDRIIVDYKLEKKMGKALTTTNTAMRVATEMAKAMGEMQTTALRKPTSAGDGPKGNGQTLDQIERIKQVYESKFGATAANWTTDPTRRRLLLNALNRVRKGNPQAIVDLIKPPKEEKKDGSE